MTFVQAIHAATRVALLAGLAMPAAADEPQAKATTTAQTAVLKTAAEDLPDGIKNFNGMLIGRLAAKDVERGTFVLQVDAVARVWENSKAEDPQSIAGKTVAVNGLAEPWSTMRRRSRRDREPANRRRWPDAAPWALLQSAPCRTVPQQMVKTARHVFE